MATALVTGATGQDGGYLVERLVAEGGSVHVLVTRDSEVAVQQSRVGDRGGVHLGNLATGEGLAEAIKAAEPDEVYNLGGISSVAYSFEHPEQTIETSGLGVLRLLEALRLWAESAGRHPSLVQASSAEIFGWAPAPQTESTPIAPISPYGAAKALGHLLAGVYRARGVRASAAILYNHESPRRPAHFVTRKITQAVAAIARGRADSLVLGSLDARRDWGWAPDYMDALVRIARAQHADDYIVATGESHSVADFVGAAFARVGIDDWSGLVTSDPAFVRPADPGELRGDSTKLRAGLGWAPTVTFEEIVGRMVDADLALLDQAPA
jgi:GDPmannose 4,6-dehydratase